MGPEADSLQAPTCSETEQRLLTRLAHEAIETAIQGRPAPEPASGSLTETLCRDTATFVTLRLHRRLRGCVGNLVARDPLYRSVIHNAIGAARRDTRFEPVTLQESGQLEVHISLLSDLVPLQTGSPAELLDQIRPGLDGVVLRQAGRVSTYLPQVWESFSKREDFLESLCRKAGVEQSAWKESGAEILVYRVSEFGDPTMP